MPTRPTSRPGLERLEARFVLSALPANTIGVGTGVVTVPGEVAEVPVNVPGRALSLPKRTTVVGIQVGPAPGSGLEPKVVASHGPGGTSLPLLRGAPFNLRRFHPFATAYTRVSQPGPLITGTTGASGTTGSFAQLDTLPGDINGDGKVDFADLKSFVVAVGAPKGDAFYKPSADFNHNGFIGHGDAKALERNFPPVGPEVPLTMQLALAPGQYALGDPNHTSGGVTRLSNVTIVGKTTPGSIVFADDSLGNYTFSGAAIATDAKGNFQFPVHLVNRLTNFEFLAMDPFGQQTVRAFPVFFDKPKGSD